MKIIKKYEINTDCVSQFVTVDESKDGKPFYEVDSGMLIKFLECNGFRKLIKSNTDYIPIRLLYDSIIIPVSDFVLKDVVMQYLDDNMLSDYKIPFMLRNYFDKNLITSLTTIEHKSDERDKNIAYLYYKNGVLKVTMDSYELIPYYQFGNYLWQQQIIDREIKLPLEINLDNFSFRNFLWNISKQKEDRFYSLISIIGYLLHSFKDMTLTKAVILTDENIDITGSSANGGTGKSILSTALSKMTSVCKKEGKNIEQSNKFFFQELEPYNNILYFDDVKRNFNFENLYSAITGDIPVEKKYHQPVNISFKNAPKILISSNYIVDGGSGYTNERRRVDFEFSDYYGKEKTPSSEFGHTFFDDWNQEDWYKFDSLMIYCIQFFLRYGIIEVPKLKLEENKIIQSTHPAFFEFAEANLLKDNSYNKKALFDKFISENQEEVGRITPILFKKWLDIYLHNYKKWKFEHYKSNGNYILKID